MLVPILCLDDELCHFLEGYRPLMSKPQYQYFVIVLVGLLLCEGRRTLVGLLEQVAERTSLSGLSWFLAEAPWDSQAVGKRWLKDFRAKMQPSGRSRTRATTQDPAQAARTPQATPRDRVSDRGRLDDAQAEGQEDGRVGPASFDDRRAAPARP